MQVFISMRGGSSGNLSERFERAPRKNGADDSPERVRDYSIVGTKGQKNFRCLIDATQRPREQCGATLRFLSGNVANLRRLDIMQSSTVRFTEKIRWHPLS